MYQHLKAYFSITTKKEKKRKIPLKIDTLATVSINLPEPLMQVLPPETDKIVCGQTNNCED